MKKLLLIVGGIFGVILFIGIIVSATNPEAQKSFQKGQNQAKEIVEQASSQQIQTVYTLSVEAKANGNKIDVTGKTNLPDGAILDVKAMRIVVLKDETEDKATLEGVGTGKASVFNGTFTTTISSNDDKFLAYQKATGDEISKVMPEVEIVVAFDPKRENPSQKPEVLSVVGNNGEKLENSQQKTVFGSKTDNPMNRLEVTTRIPFSLPQ